MIETCITVELGRAVGRIADAHQDVDCNLEIIYRDVDDPRIWLVKVENGDGGLRCVYVVDDETGTHAILTGDELVRYAAGLPIYEDA